MSDPRSPQPQPIRLSALLNPGPPASVLAAERQAANRQLIDRGREEAEATLLPHIAALEERLADEQRRHAEELAARETAFTATLSALQHSHAASLASHGHSIAGAILAAQPSLAEATIVSLVGQALQGAAPGDAGTLRLHPDMVALAPPLPAGWVAIADATLQPGTAIAESGPAAALASLADRLEQARDALEVGA